MIEQIEDTRLLLGIEGVMRSVGRSFSSSGTHACIANSSFGRISVENIPKTHEMLESGTATGKIVMDGFA